MYEQQSYMDVASNTTVLSHFFSLDKSALYELEGWRFLMEPRGRVAGDLLYTKHLI